MADKPSKQQGDSGHGQDDPDHQQASDAEPDRIDDTSSDINSLVARLLAQKEASSQTKGLWYFLSSGVFFMLVGAVTLIFAFLTIGTTHASFTFVLVVVGVAILLYGTGTQGAGNFETSAGEMKYKVGVAGGAGILAFAVAFGIVWKSEAIRDAFQVERKYARLIFRDEGDGITSMSDYIAEIKVDGSPIPSYRSGDYIVAFVPFVAGPMKQQIQVSARFFNINTDQVRNKLELQNVPFQKSLVLAISTDDAGFDFPRMKPDQVVKLSNDELAGNPDDSQRVALGVDDHGTPPANDIPPAIVQAFQ